MKAKSNMTAKINVKTLSGRILTYTVDSYEMKEGHISFFDKIDNVQRSFPQENCEITEKIEGSK